MSGHKRRDPTPFTATAHGLLSAIAHRSPNPADRLKQLHEINPGTYHRTHGIQPDTCDHCISEETP